MIANRAFLWRLLGEHPRRQSPARKWRPTFFLLSGAKKVGRHKSGQINGLCLEAPAPSTEKWRFWAPKKRHSPPFFSLPILGGGQPGPRAENREWGQRK